MLVRLCTKLLFFKAFCTLIYGCSLWCSMFQYSLNKLRVAYNDAFRFLLNEPRWCSASRPFVLYNIPPFSVVVRKSIYSLWCNLTNCDNVLVQTCLLSDIRMLSPLLRVGAPVFLVCSCMFHVHCIHGLRACYWRKWGSPRKCSIGIGTVGARKGAQGHRRNFRGTGPKSGPPLFWSGRTDPHFISTQSQKICLVPYFSEQSLVAPLLRELGCCARGPSPTGPTVPRPMLYPTWNWCCRRGLPTWNFTNVFCVGLQRWLCDDRYSRFYNGQKML